MVLGICCGAALNQIGWGVGIGGIVGGVLFAIHMVVFQVISARKG